MSDSHDPEFAPTAETTLDLDDVTFRRLGPGDASAVRDLHAALDEHDSYYRFFGPRPKHLDHLAAATASNDPGHGAVGAFLGPRLIGVPPPARRTTQNRRFATNTNRRHTRNPVAPRNTTVKDG